MSINEKIRDFDKSGEIRKKIDECLVLSERFREKYPFKSDPDSIDKLTTDDLYQKGKDCFFKWLEFTLRPLGRIELGTGKEACHQLEEFKDLLRIAVDEETTLIEKVDAPWEKIKRMGGDKHVAKKIIACYDDNILPIFRTEDLEHFFSLFVGKSTLPSNYESISLGEKYQYLTNALISVKESKPETREWTNPYFMRFLYAMYPPARCIFIDRCKIQTCKTCPLSWLKRKYRHKA